MAILTNLKYFGWLYILLLAVIGYYCFNLKYQTAINERDAAINSLNQIQLEAKLDQAQQVAKEKHAAAVVRRGEDRASAILNTKIDPGCESAMQFQLMQAVKMRETQ